MNNLSTDTERLQRIRIGGLAAGATEAQLRGLFLAHGEIASFERPLDLNTGRPGVVVYIEMWSSSALAAIAALNGHVVGGNALEVAATSPLVGWMPEADRHASSPRPRRTVTPPSTPARALAGDSHVTA